MLLALLVFSFFFIYDYLSSNEFSIETLVKSLRYLKIKTIDINYYKETHFLKEPTDVFLFQN